MPVLIKGKEYNFQREESENDAKSSATYKGSDIDCEYFTHLPLCRTGSFTMAACKRALSEHTISVLPLIKADV